MTNKASLEERIGQWRQYLRGRQAVHSADVAELEDHLRSQIDALRGAGLDEDEAFLVAVKRLGDLNALAREFAISDIKKHPDKLGKGRAIFGIVMGVIFTIGLIYVVIRSLLF